jgi:hypothetical protein
MPSVRVRDGWCHLENYSRIQTCGQRRTCGVRVTQVKQKYGTLGSTLRRREYDPRGKPRPFRVTCEVCGSRDDEGRSWCR